MTIEEFIPLAIQKNIKQIEVIQYENNSLDLAILNNQQKNFITSNETTYDIKAKINKKYVKISSNYLDESLFPILKEKSDYIESIYDDFIIENPTKTKISKAKPIKNIDLKRFLALSNLTKDYEHITNLEINYNISNNSKRIVNSNGLDISTSKNLEIFDVQATANINNCFFTNSETIYNVKDAINYEDIVKKVLKDIQLNSKQEKLKNGKYNVIVSETFMSKILKEFIRLISKEEIRKNISCMSNKINKKIFSQKLTIIEDPTNRNYPSFCRFDDEGTKTYKKEIIKNGILKTYLYNNKEALLENKTSTGNAYNNSISANNLYIKESKIENNLVQEIKNGLYISKYQDTGGITLNPTTGDISVQIYGYIIKNGKFISTFEPCILTTTIFELFNNIKEIGNMKKFKTSKTASPEVLIENMSISSN